MKRHIVLPLAVVLVVFTGCMNAENDTASANGSGAGEFAVEHIETQLRSQWARVWETLHPAHQAVASREAYVNCRQGERFTDAEVTVEETFTETLTVPGIGETETMAVTLKLSDDEDSSFLTMHTVQVDGNWVWFLTDDALAAYEAGECPS